MRYFYSLASWKWHHVEAYIIVTLFIVLSGLCKLVFHQLHWLSSRLGHSTSYQSSISSTGSPPGQDIQ
jgi:hypothetical protein